MNATRIHPTGQSRMVRNLTWPRHHLATSDLIRPNLTKSDILNTGNPGLSAKFALNHRITLGKAVSRLVI